jgi:hypothetical protein
LKTSHFGDAGGLWTRKEFGAAYRQHISRLRQSNHRRAERKRPNLFGPFVAHGRILAGKMNQIVHICVRVDMLTGALEVTRRDRTHLATISFGLLR